MPIHLVKQGDCMNTIANQYGFFWYSIWDHPKNEALRRTRKDPNVLMAGDQVFIPDIRVKEGSGGAGQTHTFRMKGVPVKLRFRLSDLDGSPRVGAPYTLTVDGAKMTGVTDEEGELAEVIPPAAKKATLKIPSTNEEYEFDLGYMNPGDFASGVQARLKNLGYYKGEITGSMDDETRAAIRRFQRHNGQEETGDTTPELLTAILESHQG
jgi:hypothetical protein